MKTSKMGERKMEWGGMMVLGEEIHREREKERKKERKERLRGKGGLDDVSHTQYWIIRGKFPASRGSIFIITFVALALIVTSLVVVMTVDPTVFERR